MLLWDLNAMVTNTTGANNTAHGFRALNKNTTASNNVAVGYEALKRCIPQDTANVAMVAEML
jgi:hypothetical protein